MSEAFSPFWLNRQERTKEIETISRHMEISLNELINRQQLRMADLYEQQGQGDSTSPIAANIKQVEDRLDELNGRLERRRTELSAGAPLHNQRYSAGRRVRGSFPIRNAIRPKSPHLSATMKSSGSPSRR